MTDAELIQRAQESEYTVADQRTTIEDLVVENERLQESGEHIMGEFAAHCMANWEKEGGVLGLTKSRERWKIAFTILACLIGVEHVLWLTLIFTR